MKKIILFLILVLALAGCQSGTETSVTEQNQVNDTNQGFQTNEGENDVVQEQETSAITESENPNTIPPFIGMSSEDWEVEVVADRLDYPWDVDMVGNVTVITENVGNLVVIEDGKLTRYEVQTSDPIVHDGGSGLLGMEVADDFAERGIAYIYYSYKSGSGLANKVVQVVFDGDSWRETKVLIEGIPGHELYNGGRIAIGPDGFLYVATGWAHEESYAQDLNNLGGKILRMNLDGTIPEDNPFPNSHVYSYGHRNPQGLAWNETGTILYSSEHGSSAHDEINRIEPGKNYGWPVVIGDEGQEGMERPLLHSGNETWAPSGIAFFENHLFVAGLRGQSLYVYNESDNALDVVFSSGERLRYVYPYEGDLYVITNSTSPRETGPSDGGLLLRLRPHQ